MAAINRQQYARILEQQLAKGKPLEQAHRTAIRRGQKITEQLRKKKQLRRKPRPLTEAQKIGWARRRKYRGSISE